MDEKPGTIGFKTSCYIYTKFIRTINFEILIFLVF